MIIKQSIEYIIRLSNINCWYYIASIAIGLIVWLKWRKINVAFLTAYCLIIFSVVVLSRETGNYSNNFILFYKYRQGINEQILANIMMFIPMGVLLTNINWKLLLIGILFSVTIEYSQLWFNRGMFDVDDIVSNTIGLVIGSVVVLLIRLFLKPQLLKMKN